MINYPHLATRLFNVPLAITPQKAEVVMAALAERFGITKLIRSDGSVRMMDDDDYGYTGPRKEMLPSEIVNGVMIIRVEGTLVQKLGTMQPYSGMTGYDGIRANLSMALEDDDVEAIMFDIDSPGGEVAGCFDLADDIYAARGQKPMWSVLSENAFSAAYAIASATDRITVPRTGGTGSVGVICMHCDMSQALGKAGITVSVIRYGDRKAEGNEYEPLSKDARSRIQADVDASGEMFVAMVARNRGLTIEEVRGTEADTFLGANGVKVGFADDVMSPTQAFKALLAELG